MASHTTTLQDTYANKDRFITTPCPSTYCVYLPLIIVQVPEIDIPSGRWPHSYGQQVSITYKWSGDLTNPSHTWRPAFQHGIDDWDNSQTLVNFYFHSGSNNTIDMVYDSDGAPGFTTIVSSNGTTDWAKAYGNLYWDIYWGYTNNQRRSVAEHEIGHMQSIGHIPRSYTLDSLMLEWFYLYELSNIYTPQTIDVDLVNQVYP